MLSENDIQSNNYRNNIDPSITLEELFALNTTFYPSGAAFVTVHTTDEHGQGYTGSRWVERECLRKHEYRVKQDSIYPNILQVEILDWVFSRDKPLLKLTN